ncbi:hypothetical protein BESB_070970 [Besnoitia besnoiti]|uniref:C3H1-type domain-containing protein n=1 Tax=Besnoitia besnoiti TaxID=94643 RepID=A0A2A9M7H6_BESBE|nr:uncharacterized protein BESB_070970 [Besnoitia besnoiti]PFH33945.1 hypothetical protein BESB_070970 [Besnoitia besnoiti]
MSSRVRDESEAVAVGVADAEGGEDDGRSYVFLRTLPAANIQAIQSEIMQRLEAIMVGQKGAEVGPDEATIQEDMNILNEYVWHLLTQEAASQGRLRKELAEFLQTNTEDFVGWLDTLLSGYEGEPRRSEEDEEGALEQGAATPPSAKLHSYDRKGRSRGDDGVSSLSREADDRHYHRHRSSRHGGDSSSDRYRDRRSSHYYDDERVREERERRHRRHRYEEERRDERRHRSRRRRDEGDRSGDPEPRRSRSPHASRRDRDAYHASSARHYEDPRGAARAGLRGGECDGKSRAGRLIGLAVKQATDSARGSEGLGLHPGAAAVERTSGGLQSCRSRSRSPGHVRAVVLVEDRSGARRGHEEGNEAFRGEGQREETQQPGDLDASANGGGLEAGVAGASKTKAILRPNPRFATAMAPPQAPFVSDPATGPSGYAPALSAAPGGPAFGFHPDGGRGLHASPGAAPLLAPQGAGSAPFAASFSPFAAASREGHPADVEMGGRDGPLGSVFANGEGPQADVVVRGGGASGLLATGGSLPRGQSLPGADAGGVPSSAQGKVRKRCIKWPRCPFGANCMYIHPTAKCTKWPRCAFGDACFYWHPAVMCKYGSNCANPYCNYTHEPVDPALAAAAASAVGATMPAGSPQTGEALPGAPQENSRAFLGTLGEDGFYRNKTWTPGSQADAACAAGGEGARDTLQASVEALSHTLPGTPPELRRAREASEGGLQGEELRLPPAEGAAESGRADEEGVMEG